MSIGSTQEKLMDQKIKVNVDLVGYSVLWEQWNLLTPFLISEQLLKAMPNNKVLIVLPPVLVAVEDGQIMFSVIVKQLEFV